MGRMSRKRSKGPLKCNNSISDVDDSSLDEEFLAADIPQDVELSIPQQLKLQLENDAFYIQRRNLLIKLPKEPNVVTLLTDYYEHCQSKTGQGTVVKNLNLLKEVLDGIITYFDFTLLDHLLYAPERKQYEAVVSRQVPMLTPAQQSSEDTPVEYCSDSVELPSRIYGVEHLLRLFVVLPRFLSRAKISQEHCDELHQCIGDFLTYLSTQTQLFNKDRYEEVAVTSS